MRHEDRGGTLAISINLELEIGEQARMGGQGLEAVTLKLVELFDRYQIPATWGVADPAVSAATEVIAGASADHEIALLGESTWVGSTAGRTRFARELERRTR